MTALALFDSLSDGRTGEAGGGEDLARRRAVMAEKLVAASLADLERVRDFEQVSYPADLSAASISLGVLESIYGLYSEWVEEAEQVVTRAKELSAMGVRVDALSRLEDAIGSVRARLKLTPAQTANAIAQALRGEFIPIKDLRDELRARVRA